MVHREAVEALAHREAAEALAHRAEADVYLVKATHVVNHHMHTNSYNPHADASTKHIQAHKHTYKHTNALKCTQTHTRVPQELRVLRGHLWYSNNPALEGHLLTCVCVCG